MPNWCANKLELIGPKELVFQFAKRWNEEIDNGSGVGFYVWDPVPEVLRDIQHGSIFLDGKEYKAWREKEDEDGETVRVPLSEEEIEEIEDEHGCTTSYEWEVANWGVKWGDRDHYEIYVTDSGNLMEEDGYVRVEKYGDDDEYRAVMWFNTPWGPPGDAIETLTDTVEYQNFTHYNLYSGIYHTEEGYACYELLYDNSEGDCICSDREIFAETWDGEDEDALPDWVDVEYAGEDTLVGEVAEFIHKHGLNDAC